MLHELPTGALLGSEVFLAVSFFIPDLSAVLVSSRELDFLVEGVENVDSVSSLVAGSGAGDWEQTDDLLSEIEGSVGNVKSRFDHS